MPIRQRPDGRLYGYVRQLVSTPADLWVVPSLLPSLSLACLLTERSVDRNCVPQVTRTKQICFRHGIEFPCILSGVKVFAYTCGGTLDDEDDRSDSTCTAT